MTLLWMVLLPFLAILPVALIGHRSRPGAAVAAALPPLIGLGLMATRLSEVMSGQVPIERWPWVHSLGLEVAFRLDGLGMLFSTLILGIGLLVVLYASAYMSEEDHIGSFFATLMTFMGAMMGVVLSENLLLMVIFWELTSISSFLLIGYWNELQEARQGARLALMITGGGGLCLLAGVVLLGHITQSFDLTVVLASGDLIKSHALYGPMLVLVLLGALTKSAQFPFHFWLPNAMTAPTPVSAYLHSATMVKAGVFLLARLHPALSGTPLWFWIVTGAGLVTFSMASYVALYKHDLKGLLAYSTISHLGIITALFGLSTRMATVAAVFHIMNHAAFKASLFMSVGIIDHETGTRDLRVLSGLRAMMPWTFALVLLGALAMGGAPLFNGFLSKELFFEEIARLNNHPLLPAGSPWAYGLPALVTLGGACSVAYSIKMVWETFMGPEAHELPSAHPHDPPWLMRGPVLLLVTLCVLIGVMPTTFAGAFLAAAAQPVVGAKLPEYTLSIWHGLTPALGMTAVAIVLGLALYKNWARIHAQHLRLGRELSGKATFEALIEACFQGATILTRAMDSGSLQRYFAFIVATTCLAGAVGYLEAGRTPGTVSQPAPLVAIVPWALLLISTGLMVLYHRARLTAITFASVIGLVVSLAFVYLSAPDLALTQLSVEVVTIMLILVSLHVLPQRTPRESTTARKLRDGALSILAGVGATFVALDVFTRPGHSAIADFYLERSLPEGGGANVVNVILVDFRGFDTMGEVSVLALAAIGIVLMLQDKAPIQRIQQRSFPEERSPLMLTTVTRPFMALILTVAIYIFLRGHNLPGGGFIAGLIASVALMTQYLASGRAWTSERLNLDLARMCALGVLLAVCTGMAAWAMGSPFLDNGIVHLHIPVLGELHLTSAIPFDLGVFLVVVGALIIIIRALGRYHREPADQDPPTQESP